MRSFRLFFMVVALLCTQSVLLRAQESPDFETLLKLKDKPRSRKQLKAHLEADTMKSCSPDPKQLWEFARPGSYKFSRSLIYLERVALPYQYDIAIDEKGTAKLSIRIRFKGELAAPKTPVRELMQERLDKAAALWSKALPAEAAGRFSFEFKIVDENAHYSVDLIEEKSRGPYYMRWSTLWDSVEISHELGHMMGLLDEYDLIKEASGEESSEDCDSESIMCESGSGAPQLYQAYLVFRRLLCEEAKPRN